METKNVLSVFEALNKNVYSGGASRIEVQKRRAKNKLARKQRKINNKK